MNPRIIFIRKSFESNKQLRSYRELGQFTGFMLTSIGNASLAHYTPLGLYALIPFLATTTAFGIYEIARKKDRLIL